MTSKKLYRPNVCGIILYKELILLCKRSDFVGEWQFPQGGIDPKETPLKGFYREMREELSIPKSCFKSVKVSKIKYRYRFPRGRLKWENGITYVGQEQTFVLAVLKKIPKIVLNHEFLAYVLVEPKFLKHFPYSHFKRSAAMRALRHFDLL